MALASHRARRAPADSRGTCLTRRDEGAYRASATEERRSRQDAPPVEAAGTSHGSQAVSRAAGEKDPL